MPKGTKYDPDETIAINDFADLDVYTFSYGN